MKHAARKLGLRADMSSHQNYRKRTGGRVPAIPERLLPLVLQHFNNGASYRDIVLLLRNTYAIDASRWSVRRAVMGLRPYNNAGNANSAGVN